MVGEESPSGTWHSCVGFTNIAISIFLGMKKSCSKLHFANLVIRCNDCFWVDLADGGNKMLYGLLLTSASEQSCATSLRRSKVDLCIRNDGIVVHKKVLLGFLPVIFWLSFFCQERTLFANYKTLLFRLKDGDACSLL